MDLTATCSREGRRSRSATERIETKELLGGFVILETANMEEALRIAAEWPSLATQPQATVQLQPVFVRA